MAGLGPPQLPGPCEPCRPSRPRRTESPVRLPSLCRGRAQLSRWLGRGRSWLRGGGGGLAFLGQGSWLLSAHGSKDGWGDGRAGRHRGSRHRVGKECTHWQGRKRETGRPSVREAGFSEGRKITGVSETERNQKKRDMGHRATPGALGRGRAGSPSARSPHPARGASMVPVTLARPRDRKSVV